MSATFPAVTPAATDPATPADCEQRDGWGLEQDVNAWSSLAYVAAGLVLIAEIRRCRLPAAVYLFAAATVVEGVGSLLYHGRGGDVAQFLHDVPLIAGLGFVAGWHSGRLRADAERWAVAGLLVGALVSAAIWAWAPGLTNVAVGVLVAIIATSSIVARRRRMAPVWNVPILVLGGAALAMWALGNRNSPACDSESWLQSHAAWHVLTAVIAVLWVDLAYTAARPDDPPRMFRRFTDRTIGLVARGLVLGFHRSVDVSFRQRLPRRGPMLIVANHGNGFVDPVVVASVLGRLPRFLAKAALWKVPVARPFLALAGVLPVYRSGDGDRATDNVSVFDACHRELARGGRVAIFPEGTTGDRAGLDRVKSGAARIALGALPTTPDLVIVPIGLAFESKVETRSRAVVMFGEPIVVADYAASHAASHSASHSASHAASHAARGGASNGLDGTGEPDRADVRALTDRITEALEAISPSFADVDEREILRAAAGEERAAAAHDRSPSFGETEVVARRLARAADDARALVVDAYRDFATRLELIGVRARQLRAHRVSTWRVALSVVVLLVAGSLVLTATLIHLPAIVLVVVGTGWVRSTATKGTVRLLLGLVCVLTTWIVAGMWLGDGWVAVGFGLAIAAGGVVALVVWPPLVREATALVGRVRIRDRIGLLPPVLEARSRVVESVRAIIEDRDD